MKNVKKLLFALTAILCLQQPCHAGFTDTLSSWGSSALQWIQQNPRITGLFATIFTAQAVYSYKQKTTIQEQIETIRKQNITVQEKNNTIEEQANNIENLTNQISKLSLKRLKLRENLSIANEELDELKKALEKTKNPVPAWNGPGGFFLTDEERSAQYEREERQQRINEEYESRPKPTLGEQYAEGYIKIRKNLPSAVQALTPISAPWSN